MKTGNKAFSAGFSAQFKKNQSFFARKIALNPALRPSLLAVFSLIIGIFLGTYLIPVSTTFANTKIDISDATTSNTHTRKEEKTVGI